MNDRYRDAVMTVIAVCLLVLVLRPLFGPGTARADAESERADAVRVNIVEIGGFELLARSALPVEIESGPVPVEIRGGAGKLGCGCP